MPGPLYRRPFERPGRTPGGGSAAWTVTPKGGLPLPPVEIPFSWISDPIVRKPTTAITKAQVSQAGGTTSYSSASAALVRQFGANSAVVSLSNASDADQMNLAVFFTTYQATPRPRQPLLTLNLFSRTEAEADLILAVPLAARVRVTGAPAATPPGALNFTLQGIRHVMGVEVRTVTWSTAALIGTTTTAPGLWFRLGTSTLGGSDLVPF